MFSISFSAGGIVIRDGKICLVRDKRLGLENWFIPKGKIEKKEKPLETAVREIREETGIEDLKLVKKLGVIKRKSVSNPRQMKFIHIFLFNTNQRKLKPEPKMEAGWFTPMEALEKLYTKQEKRFVKKNMHLFIKGIIFDFSGVFTIDGNFESFSKKYSKRKGLDPDELMNFMIESWRSVELGKDDSWKFWERLGSFIGCKPEEIREEMMKFYRPRWGMVRLVKSLKGRYLLGMISNHIKDWFEYNIKMMGLEEIFDEIVASYKVGLMKPDKRIYQLTIKRMGLRPWECVFVDDLERNLKPAEEMGMKTLLFRGEFRLKRDFRRMGIKV